LANIFPVGRFQRFDLGVIQALEHLDAMDLARKAKEAVAKVPRDILARASAFLVLKGFNSNVAMPSMPRTNQVQNPTPEAMSSRRLYRAGAARGPCSGLKIHRACSFWHGRRTKGRCPLH
jgi:hypothetical protein